MNAGFNPAISFAMPLSGPANRQERDRINSLKAQYSGACGCAAGACQEHSADELLKKIKAENLAHIVGHEQDHQRGNPYAGGMVIEYDGNGVARAGHVDISMPGLNPQNPEDGYKAYGIIRASALAPSDPSGQDLSVASQAQAMMGQAKVLIDQKRQAERLGLPPGVPLPSNAGALGKVQQAAGGKRLSPFSA